MVVDSGNRIQYSIVLNSSSTINYGETSGEVVVRGRNCGRESTEVEEEKDLDNDEDEENPCSWILKVEK